MLTAIVQPYYVFSFREEIAIPIDSRSRLYDLLQKTQAARCLGCGTPTCSYPHMLDTPEGGGCPLGNRIPSWSALVVEGQWKLAVERLLDTNNFPEFTGRICPAPCEAACILAPTDGSVAIKSIELAIIEKGFQEGWVTPMLPKFRTGQRVAIVGSGPSGLAAAQSLNRVGYQVTVFERSDRIGGLLIYGIANMKLDKKKVVQRRVDLLAAEGIIFKTNVCVGQLVKLQSLLKEYDAVLLAVGTQRQVDLLIPGRQLEGVIQGLEFLVKSQKSLLDSDLTVGSIIGHFPNEALLSGRGDDDDDLQRTSSTVYLLNCRMIISLMRSADV